MTWQQRGGYVKARLTVLLLCTVIWSGARDAAGQSRDTSWEDTLSKQNYPAIKFRMYQIAMPDGVKLSAAVWTPEVNDQKFPVILIATPYNKLDEDNIAAAVFFARRGYAFVAYDLRGRYDSEGYAYLYGEQDGKD